jgi:cytochrome b subunit of formate dehydrogenase
MRLFSRITHWLLVAVLILYGISGLGITQFRIVEAVTFGMLSKELAFRMHDMLWIPFMILLALHIAQLIMQARKKRTVGT